MKNIQISQNAQKNKNQKQPILDVQRYLKNKPAIYNCYYKINLISFIEQLPSILSNSQKKYNPERRQSVQKIAEEANQIQCKGFITESYQHQVDRLNQDVKINQYNLTGLLGRGAHSMVKTAKDQTAQIYAVKILWLDKIRKKFFIKQKQLIEMIKTQIQILSSCKHKNIINLKEAIYVKQKQRMFVILQNCSQGTILKYMSNFLSLQDNQWWKVAKSFIKQFLQGVKFLHSKNIIHRDIKPQNLLINSSNQLKIIDFNISKSIKQGELLKITNKFIGTKSYAAPELIFDIQKQKQVDGKKVDMWAVGISIIQILQRKHPLPAKTLEELQKMLKKQIKLNPEYDKQLTQMLSKLISLNAKERLSASQALQNIWFSKD